MSKTIRREKTQRKRKRIINEQYKKTGKIKKFKDFIYEEEELDDEELEYLERK